MTHIHFNADCMDALKQLGDSSIDMVVTSPPYADARKREYGGPHPDKYAEWFLPVAEQIKRILNPNGTFILNIKEKTVKGERHPYVIELILALRKQGWLWTEEWIWHKKNCFPGKWPNRFRDAWERCLQFNISRKFKMNQESVMVPIGDWASDRLKNLNETDKTRDDSRSGSSFGKNVSNWVGRGMVFPTNVLHLPTECSNKNHPAAFPKTLPEFFIKLFTDEGNFVLDPFEGCGTTGLAAVGLRRKYIGIEMKKEYHETATHRINALAESLT